MGSRMEKKVTIVIPNYNGKRFLDDCLSSLERQTSKDFETLVIDNASQDDSVSYIREHYPWVKIAVMRHNLGFSGGVNVGIGMCMTPYVLLLNNDTRSFPKMVEELIKTMESADDIFSVSCKMIQFHDHEKMDDAGDLYTCLGWAFQRGVGQPVGDYREPAEVFSACAGAAMYRRELFAKIGLFDELHFVYLEDLDLGYRAKIQGYRNVYCPTAKVYHVGSGTSGSKYNSFKVKLSARNSVYVNYKNMPLPQLILNAPTLAAGYFVKWCFFMKIGFGKDYVDGLKEGISTRKKCKKVFFRGRDIRNYWQIQKELWENTVTYIIELAKRKL